jgi:HEAT repeats
VIRLRFAVSFLLAIGSAAPVLARGDGRGLFYRNTQIDPARVRQLAEIIRSDPDEKRRKAAIAELCEADPRVHPDVIPALIAALRKDVATVRAAAAEAIGRFSTVFPLAGAALETAAESDASQVVRDAAQQSLWEYHLNGYRSGKVADATIRQTAEPPIAKPNRARPIATEPLTAPVVATAGMLPPSTSTAASLPPFGVAPGPRVDLLPHFFNFRAALSGSTHYNLTIEPPLAKSATPMVPGPTPSSEPPIMPRYPDPVVVGKAPPIAMDLPPIVSPPGEN